MWVDTHCHLGDEKIDLNASLDAARLASVSKMVTIGCAKSEWVPNLEFADSNEDVWVALGVHPHEAKDGIDGLEGLLEKPKVVAVGECGLDYHYDYSPREAQREVFTSQIQLANTYDLPLVIHTREAWDETFELLDAVGTPAKTVFHCFTGGVQEAEKCLERGAFLSFSGIATFPSARSNVAEAAAMVPSDRFVLETDAPYLAPVPLRGQSNQPANVAVTGTFIAELRGQTPEEVATLTSTNAATLFGI